MRFQLMLLLGICLSSQNVFSLPWIIPKDVTNCDDLVQGRPNIDVDEIELTDIDIPLEFGRIAKIDFTASNVTISGLSQLEFTDCRIDADTKTVYLADKISQLDIYFTNYNLEGLFDEHIELEGHGDASVMIEDFTVAAMGNLTIDIKDPSISFSYLQLDLGMYQWTVNFENFMEGTDMGPLFNEFFSEVGPETIDTLEGILNEGDANEQLTDTVNAILKKIIDKITGDDN